MSAPILIAECCQNHNGSYPLLLEMLNACKESGADYAKIQSIRSKNLTFRERFENGIQASDGTVRIIKRPFAEEQKRLSKLDLSIEQEAAFVEACRKVGLRSMTTIFDRSTVSEVCSLGFDAVKIASYDCSSLPLIKDVADKFSTIFVSTGASTDSEIITTANLLSSKKHIESYLLHCVTIYPTPTDQFHLARLGFLKLLSDNIGLSSHPAAADLGINADKIALSLGAGAIERHFTVLPRSDSKDGPVSITPDELAELRQFCTLSLSDQKSLIRETIPDWSTYLGCASRELSHEELLNRDYYRGRFASPLGQDKWRFNWE